MLEFQKASLLERASHLLFSALFRNKGYVLQHEVGEVLGGYSLKFAVTRAPTFGLLTAIPARMQMAPILGTVIQAKPHVLSFCDKAFPCKSTTKCRIRWDYAQLGPEAPAYVAT